MPITGSQTAPTVARHGFGRHGGTRHAYFQMLTFLTVAASDRSSGLDWPDLVWIERIGNDVDKLTFTLIGGAEPTEGQVVELALGAADRTVFGGPLTRCRMLNEHPSGDATGLAFECEAIDYSKWLNRRRVTGRYTGSADTIVTSVLSDFTSGFTTANVVAAAPSIDTISFKYTTLAEALTRVAERVGWVWYVDADKDIHFFDPAVGEGTQQAVGLSEPGLGFWGEAIEKSGAQVRTRAIVEGWGTVTTAAVAAADTSITVEDETGIQQLLTDGYSGVGIIGVDEFTFTGTSAGSVTGVPASGAGSIANAYNIGESVNIIVKRNDAGAQTARAAVEGGDGIHEIFVQDRRLSPDGAASRGDQEVNRWSAATISGSYETHDRHARAGRIVNINLPTVWGVSSTDRTIHEVVTRWDSNDRFRRSVRFGPPVAPRKFGDVLKQAKLSGVEA